jgi:hypothetical protein
MSVAYAAYQQLTPAEKARVAVLLKLNPFYSEWVSYIKPPAASTDDENLYIFMMAATWPDEIRSNTSGYVGNDDIPKGEKASLNDGYSAKQRHEYWHFIDTPLSMDGTKLPAIPTPSIVDKIGVFRAALASSETDLLKSYDLVWLIHLVGDVHQPLHASTRVSKAKPHGDAGGNSVLVKGPDAELHAFWDDAVGSGDTRNFMNAVKVGQSLPQADSTKASDANEVDWAAESFALAKSDVYVDPVGPGLGPYDLSGSYTTNTKQVAEQRIALAGARLANLIKTALNCGPESCAN